MPIPLNSKTKYQLIRLPIVRRGLGESAPVYCTAEQDAEFDNCTQGCYTTGGQGVPCPTVTSVDVCDKKPGSMCFQFGFPWAGKITNCKCVPAFNVPEPWGKIITGSILALGAYKLLRGMR